MTMKNRNVNRSSKSIVAILFSSGLLIRLNDFPSSFLEDMEKLSDLHVLNGYENLVLNSHSQNSSHNFFSTQCYEVDDHGNGKICEKE